jgi:hypothetical protein
MSGNDETYLKPQQEQQIDPFESTIDQNKYNIYDTKIRL